MVYPKYIKVVSGSEVVSASVNFNEGGGSGNGSSSGDSNFVYYKFDSNDDRFHVIDHIYDYDETQYIMTHIRAQLNGNRYMYGSFAAVVRYFGKQSQNPYPDAFVFAPMSLFLGSDVGYMTINSYEEAMEIFPDVFPPATRITAEEYWQYLKV